MAGSQNIKFENSPDLPNFAYYNTRLNNNERNSYDKISNNLKNFCKPQGGNWKKVKGLGATLDEPFEKAKSDNNYSRDNLKTPNQDESANQIQYLICQLEQVRNRSYDPKSFVTPAMLSLKDIFNQFSGGVKILLIVLFMMTMYLLISGFFGSIDIACNIFSAIEKNNKLGSSYWAGLLIGLALPVILLSLLYKNMVCNNLNQLEGIEITTDEKGKDGTKIPQDQVNIDYVILILFILIIYAFTATLFTIKRNNFGDTIYSIIIGSILFILAIFIYLLYAYVPFFNTSDKNEMLSMTSRPLRLFISQKYELSDITSNQTQDASVQKSFVTIMILMLVLTILFFIFGKSNGNEEKSSFMSFISGILSSSAVLILPILWVFNFIIAIKFFFLYPILMILFRFIRYIGMGLVYLVSSKSEMVKDMFSNDLVEQLENFKDYSPSWSLVGVDLIKSLLNIFGYENIFSKSIIANDDSRFKNISSNAFISGAFLNFLFLGNKKGMTLMIITFVLAIIITVIIIFGVCKISLLNKTGTAAVNANQYGNRSVST
jgi:hypothetical protein